MVKIEFLGPIQKESIEVEISNLNELKSALNADENLQKWLEISAVAVNDRLVFDKNFVLKNGDKISLLPPVCGG